MKKMCRWNRISIITFVLIVIAPVYLTAGCGKSFDGYKKITINNELGSYSFEYPSYYKKKIQDNLEFDIPYTHLVLAGPTKTEEAEIFDPETGEIITVTGNRGTSVIYVHISNYKIYYGESYTAYSRIERVLEGEAKWANFRLLERTPVTVSGVEVELIVYLVDKLMPIPVEDGKNLEYVRAAYFDYSDLTWEIVAKCNQNIQEEVTVYFNHVIETFEILE